MRELSVEMTPTEDFFKVNPPSAWISRVFDPPLARISRIPSVMGVWIFFWNNPMVANWVFAIDSETL